MGVGSASFTWRPLGLGDAEAAADLLNAMEAVDRIGENYTAQDTFQELVDPYADLERASVAVFDGELMVGFMKIRFKPEAEVVHRVFLDGGVRPDYRRRGVGAALVDAGIAAAKVVHELHHPTRKLVVDVHKGEHIAGLGELLASRGFAAVRYFQHMKHPLGDAIPDRAVPAGLRVEPWSEQNDEDFRSIRNEAFRDHWGSAPMPVDSWRNKIVNHTFRSEVSFLLRDLADGRPVGMVTTSCWEADTEATGVRDAVLTLVGTLRHHRRRGVAGALVGHALRAAAQHGFGRASVTVDSANPSGAFGIFEKAGFTPEVRFVRWALEV